MLSTKASFLFFLYRKFNNVLLELYRLLNENDSITVEKLERSIAGRVKEDEYNYVRIVELILCDRNLLS